MGEDKKDSYLVKLTRVLEKLASKGDVRKYIRRIVKSEYAFNVRGGCYDYVGKGTILSFRL